MAISTAAYVSEDDLPSLFHAADSASKQQQKEYLKYIFLELALMVLGAVAGSIALNITQGKVIIALISAALFGGGLLLTFYIRDQQFEQHWYDGRAIAESIKTQAWRFMMCSEPYPKGLSEADSEGVFMRMLAALLKERKRFAAFLGAGIGTDPPITSKMREIRQLPFEERKRIYITDRINNQRDWYSRKAKENLDASKWWFKAIIIAQGLALLSSFILVQWPDLPINGTSIFAALATACIAWQQLKKQRELANSYGLAAEELILISGYSNAIRTAEELAGFVSDAENAISREHTMWIARRDQS